MMINLYFQDPSRDNPKSKNRTLVATIAAEDLDQAYYYTQNLDGSWSKDEKVNGLENPDYRDCITVYHKDDYLEYDDEKYAVVCGKIAAHESGLRSSMMGDFFEAKGRLYRVERVGFRNMLTGDIVDGNLNIVEKNETVPYEA